MRNASRIWSLVIAVVAAVTMLAGPTNAATKHSSRVYLPNEGAVSLRMYRPHWFTFSGDCGEWEQNMRWSRWNHRKAVGHGTDVNGGKSCAPVARRPVTVTLSRPRTYCGHRVFTRAGFEFPADPARNFTQTSVYWTDC